MTEQHTPGDWQTAATDDSLVVVGRLKIASTYEVPGDVWGAANARLIAAAPDLLAALGGLLAAYEKPDQLLCCNGHHCGCMGASIRDQAEYFARAAIAKARVTA